MKIFNLFFLLFFIHVTQAQETFRNDNLGFSMEHPKKWIVAQNGETLENFKAQIKLDADQLKKMIEQSKGTVQVVTFYKYQLSSRAGVIPTIKVNLRRNPSRSFEIFKQSMEKSLNGMKEIFPDLQFVQEPIGIKVSGKESVYASCTYTLKSKSG